jgi:hypothetical protein
LAARKKTFNLTDKTQLHSTSVLKMAFTITLIDTHNEEIHIHAAMVIAEQTGNVMVRLWCLIGQSMLYRKRGQVEETRCTSLLALEVATAIPRPEQIATAQANLA